MTIEEFQATLNGLDTEIADLREAIHAGIAKAREINSGVRSGQEKLRTMEQKAGILRMQIREQRKQEALEKAAAEEKTE